VMGINSTHHAPRDVLNLNFLARQTTRS